MKNRNYKPTKISDSLKSLNKEWINKFGKIDYIIFSKWSEIVGTFFAQYSQADKITALPNPSKDGETDYTEKILHVSVAPAAAIEFQHFQNKILEKINSFFGYKAIHYIKIHQKFSSKNIHKKQIQNKHFEKNLLNKKRNKINDTSQKINDKELENSLFNLGLSIEQNDKK